MKTKGVRLVLWINADVPQDTDVSSLSVEFPGGMTITSGTTIVEGAKVTDFVTVESELDDESAE